MHKNKIVKADNGIDTSSLILNQGFNLNNNSNLFSLGGFNPSFSGFTPYLNSYLLYLYPYLNFNNIDNSKLFELGNTNLILNKYNGLSLGMLSFNQAMGAIASGTSSPYVKGATDALGLLGSRLILNVGTNLISTTSKLLGKTFLKEGTKGLTKNVFKNALKSGLKSTISAASLGGVALDTINQFAPEKQEYLGEKGSITKGLDKAYDTVSDVVNFIPGIGTALSLGMKGASVANKYMNKLGAGTDAMTSTDAILGSNFLAPIGWINGFTGKNSIKFDYGTREDKVDRNYLAGSYNYSTIDRAAQLGDKKYGGFSAGARRKANDKISKANIAAGTLKSISLLSLFNNTFGNAMQNINTVDYLKNLQGYLPTYMHAGKKGMKIGKNMIEDITDFKPIIADTLDTIDIFKDGGSFNIIPDGALHARKHNMENSEGLTKKGIPVVDKDGKLQAEIERDEIIFRKEVTDAIEEAMKDGSDSKAIEIGKMLVKEIFKNTLDNTGLIESITKESPKDIESKLKNHEVFIDKKLNGGLFRTMELLVKYANEKNPRFIQRMLEPTLRTIKNLLGLYMSHLLGYGEDEFGKTYVFPQILEIDGKLVYMKDWREAFSNAMKNNNVIEMSPQEAELFTNNYKKYYKSFNPYLLKKLDGGIINLNNLTSNEKDTLLQLLLQKATL